MQNPAYVLGCELVFLVPALLKYGLSVVWPRTSVGRIYEQSDHRRFEPPSPYFTSV